MYSHGQLIFTTHNASPMDILRTKKHAIDFMSMSGSINPWKEVGNYAPANLYKKGLIQGLPLNIEAEAFMKVFSDES